MKINVIYIFVSILLILLLLLLLRLFTPSNKLEPVIVPENCKKYVENCIYINLDSRTDRRNQTEEELRRIGINPMRFSAIKNKKGAIGCTMSHIKCLEIAIAYNWDYVFICEDDIHFLDPNLFYKQLSKLVEDIYDWDVILVAGNNKGSYEKVNDYCIKVSNCLTTTGYIVCKKYYNILLNNFRDGLNYFQQNPSQKDDFAIDTYWKNLQIMDNWFLITPLSVIQREGYSDIEKKDVNYKKDMIREM